MLPYNEKAIQIIDEVNKVVIGKRMIIGKVLTAILAKGHILLEDNPGVGKTTLALAFSKAMTLEHHRLQFTPDVLPTDVVGFHLPSKDGDSYQYRPGAIMCNLFLADEINRTSSKTQSALLEVMEEGRVTVDSVTREVPKPFCCYGNSKSHRFYRDTDASGVPAGPFYDKAIDWLSGSEK